MRKDRRETAKKSAPPDPNLETLKPLFDRPEVAAACLFGSTADGEPHELSDIDLAYLATSGEAEERLFDELYEALQRQLGEGNFDLVPLRRAPLHLQFAITMEGRLIVLRDPVATERFAARAIARHLDFKPYRDWYFRTGS